MIKFPETEVHSVDRLDRMWKTPVNLAVPNGWQIPQGVKVGLASQNPVKIEAIKAVVNTFGQSDLITGPPYEKEIATFLDRNEFAPWVDDLLPDRTAYAAARIRGIAAFKSLAAFGEDLVVTHGLGLDIDMVYRGQDSLRPVGKPQTLEEFRRILEQLSDKFAEVHCSAALTDARTQKLLSFDTVRIFFKFASFQPNQFIRAVGEKGIGRLTAGFDLADFAVTPFIDPGVPVRVNRMDHFPPDDHSGAFIKREVTLRAQDISLILHEYVTGTSQALIGSVIYNGIVNAGNFPILP